MTLQVVQGTWLNKGGYVRFRGPFLETPGNFPGPNPILGAQCSRIAIRFLLILKVKF